MHPPKIDSTCLLPRPARIKKPGSPLAGRAALECVVRFCEGNGSCVHRLEPPGGVPFRVARFRVVFNHSLSQGLLLKRNLNSVFLCVNNLMQLFFAFAPRRRCGRHLRTASCMRALQRVRAPLQLQREKKSLVSWTIFFFARVRVLRSTRAQSCFRTPNGSPTRLFAHVFVARRKRVDPASHKSICANFFA